MSLRPLITTTITTTIFSLLKNTSYQFFSTKVKIQIPPRYRPQAIQQAEEAIIEYLHTTRSLPFFYAQHIVKNASFSLSSIISQIPFHHSTFLNSLQKFLRYNPINEFQFFYESIGIEYKEIKPRLPVDKLFLSEDSWVFNAACDLADFGFPWNKLGVFCEKVDVFSNQGARFGIKLDEFKDRYGFDNKVIVGICLAFPHVLYGIGETDELLCQLRKVLVDTDLVNLVEGTYEVCRKFRLFYELGCDKGVFDKGVFGELLVMNRHILVDYTEDDLVRKIEFFCRLGVDKDQVGLLLLLKPDILKYDLEDRVISVLRFLKHFNLSEENLKHIQRNYPYVLGKNRMVNVPHIIRATDLSEWFFNMVLFGDHSLLATYAISSQDEDADDDYRNKLQKIISGVNCAHNTSKLEFLHGIGFGENKFAMKALPNLRGSSSQLYERFNLLLSRGFKFSKLCKLVSSTPKILHQNTFLLERKAQFLHEEMASSLQCLDEFPSYFLHNLEKRIKPRFKFYLWLKAQGLWKSEYTVANLIDMSEKRFIDRISSIHPDALKKWFESQKETMKQVTKKSQST